MKILLVSLMLFSPFAQMAMASGLDSILTKESAVLLKNDASESEVFMSYPGELSNQCGIRLVAINSGGAYHTQKVIENIEVTAHGERIPADSQTRAVSYDVSEHVLSTQLYGIFINLTVKNGKTFGDLVNPDYQEQLLVVSTPCE